MNTMAALTDTTDLMVAALMRDEGREVIIMGLGPDTITLTDEAAYDLAKRLIAWSGKVPAQKRTQRPSKATTDLAETVTEILDADTTVERADAMRAPTYDVLRLIAREFVRRGHTVPTQAALGRALRLAGFPMIRSNGERFYGGIYLRNDAPTGHSAPSAPSDEQGR